MKILSADSRGIYVMGRSEERFLLSQLASASEAWLALHGQYKGVPEKVAALTYTNLLVALAETRKYLDGVSSD